MAQPPAGPSPDLGEFDLAGWRVQPSLNRLSRGDATVRVEPKQMDVLVFLAQHAGRVVSKDALAGAVWPAVFLSESVITRAIAGLRRALADDARQPRLIETIAKRGYRLLARPTPLTSEPLASAAPSAAPGGAPVLGERSSARPASPPYVVGQWVRGESFYGREAELSEILDGPRNGLWLLGSRAIGKTSMLKHLEHLAAASEPRRYFPLFWDLQGSDDPERLDADFEEALAEAEGRLAGVGLSPGEVAAPDFLAALGRLRRALAARGLTLLLLLDEAEELVRLQERAPALLRKLRRALQSPEGIRTVMASSSRLWRLADRREDTSPFLHGFTPPVYLGSLEDGAARRLVRQGQGAPGAGSHLAAETVDQLLRRSGGHPYLLQALAARTWQLGDLERATEEVAADASVRRFFALDFDLLSELERALVLALAGHPAGVEMAALGLDAPAGDCAACALHLERLGVVRSLAGSRLAVRSPILQSWLAEAAAQKL